MWHESEVSDEESGDEGDGCPTRPFNIWQDRTKAQLVE